MTPAALRPPSEGLSSLGAEEEEEVKALTLKGLVSGVTPSQVQYYT